jgi:hypothetical protein
MWRHRSGEPEKAGCISNFVSVTVETVTSLCAVVSRLRVGTVLDPVGLRDLFLYRAYKCVKSIVRGTTKASAFSCYSKYSAVSDVAKCLLVGGLGGGGGRGALFADDSCEPWCGTSPKKY